MPFPLIFLPLLAQVGPSGTQMQAPLDLPRRKTAVAAPQPRPSPVASRFGECLALARSQPGQAIDLAAAWRDAEKGSARIEPERCLGLALTGLGRWDEAVAAFTAARDDTPANESDGRARLGALAANAALAKGDAKQALSLLDAAHGEALAAGNAQLAGEVAIDRARALVALKSDNEAEAALTEARHAAPGNATGWLLSATLYRRQGKLAEAQAAIEQAGALQPTDPEIGLEAGVIAILGGRDEAARKSWQSVLAAAPESDAAKIARGYLDQLGPAAAPSAR